MQSRLSWRKMHLVEAVDVKYFSPRTLIGFKPLWPLQLLPREQKTGYLFRSSLCMGWDQIASCSYQNVANKFKVDRKTVSYYWKLGKGATDPESSVESLKPKKKGRICRKSIPLPVVKSTAHIKWGGKNGWVCDNYPNLRELRDPYGLISSDAYRNLVQVLASQKPEVKLSVVLDFGDDSDSYIEFHQVCSSFRSNSRN